MSTGSQAEDDERSVQSHPDIDPIRPLLAGEREAARRACAAHADCVTALYGGAEIGDREHLRILFNPFVVDPDWNLGVVPTPIPEDWPAALGQLRRELISRNRRPTVLLDSRDPEALAAFPGESWEEAFRFSGLIYPASRETPTARFPDDVEVVEYEPEEAPVEDIADVFEAAFGTAVEEGLDPGYRNGIAAGLERAARVLGGPRLRSTVVREGGVAAGIGFRVQVGTVVGLYNLGVSPAFRGRRLGGAITEQRVARARAEGAETVFLLTEDPRVEASQIKRGFVPGFELLGLTERSANSRGQ